MDNTALLNALLRGPQSGVDLAAEFGVSRAAIWKRIAQLRERGVAIATDEQRGYVLQHPAPLLDTAVILAHLDPDCRQQLQALQLDFETDSTQVQAMAQAAPAQGVAVWLAESQLAGRGRRGKTWCSPPLANIHCSINRRFALPVAAMSGLSLASAVIIASSLRQQGIDGLALKWPNDLWLHGRKCAGLLIQLRGETGGPCEVTLGFGVNVHLSRPAGAGIDQPWTALAEHASVSLDRNRVLAGLLGALISGFARYEQEGLPAFIEDWRILDALQGSTVCVEEGGRHLIGRALGIDSDGALLLETTDGRRRMHSGEVSVRVAHG